MSKLHSPFALTSKIVIPLAALSLLAVGCAQQVGDIDRTNPGRIEKAAFEGEWYFLQTVVDVNGTAITSFVGLQGQLERIVFDIEEDYLVAYNTHEDVLGIDTNLPGSELDPTEFGRPVAAYTISSHFDVQRQYNSSTGEQTNVIVENTSDRNWYEQEFIRVDWSTNNIETLVDPIISIADESAIAISPQDMGDDITWFVERNEDDEIVYIDVLSQYVIEPEFIDCVLTFGYPLYGGWCGPETITVRSSFAKITEESDYVPVEYDDDKMATFGVMRTRRSTYDRNYGPRDAGLVSLANIWNMWETSRRDDGSVLPYAEREPGQIVYYLNDVWPEELKETAFAIIDNFDNAFRRIVAAHRGIEIPSDPRRLAEELSYDVVPRIVYLCDNPGGTEGPYEISNQGYALGYCQRPGEVKHHGDLRFSFFNWVDTPQQDGPGGYGPSANDPMTGETINGVANIYGAYMDTASQYTLDLAKMITGEIDPVEYGFGNVIGDYFDNLREQNNGDIYRGLGEYGPERMAQLRDAAAEIMARPRVQNILSRGLDEFRVRNAAQTNPFELLRGTQLEQMAILPEMQQRLMPPEYHADMFAGNLDPNAPLTADQVSAMSLATVGDPMRMLQQEQQRALNFAHHGENEACILRMSLDDPYYYGIAQDLAEERTRLLAEGMSIEDIDALQWQGIRENFLYFLLAHEAGHTFGLRHNFEGSWDALNYGPEYWELRQQTFDTCDPQVVTFDIEGMSTGDVAPPLCGDAGANETQAQYDARNADVWDDLLRGRIHDHMLSSVMDYPDRFATVLGEGLGLYDYAAYAYAYGELVEVFNDPPQQLYVEVNFDPATDNFMGSTIRQSEHTMRDFDDVDEYFIRRRNQIEGDDPLYRPRDEPGHEHSSEWYHYSTLPIMFGGDVEAMYDRRLVPIEQVNSNVVVPYRFCGDEYAWTSVECQLWDQGADFLESYAAIENSWEEKYPLRHFRRGRASFGLWLWPHLSGVFNYTMAPMTRFYQYWLVRASNRGVAWYASDWGGYDTYLSAIAGLDFLANQVTRPSVGTYYFDEDLDMYMNLDYETGYQAPFDFEIEENINPDSDYLDIGLDVGRYQFELYRQDRYEDPTYFYFLEPQVLSWFYSKWAAMMALTLSSVDIIGVDAGSDYTAYSIPPFTVFPEELTAFFGALPREDFSVLGACVEMKDGGRQLEAIHQRNLISGAPRACNTAANLNPYTEVYGNADFNMRLLSTLYAAAYFQTNYSPEWFDLATVYIMGRGFDIEPGDGYTLVVYEHDNGVQYGAMAPEVIDAEIDENMYVGMQFIYRAQELRDIRDAEFLANGESDDYWTFKYDLENLLEDMRLLNQANKLFEGWNVFVPATL